VIPSYKLICITSTCSIDFQRQKLKQEIRDLQEKLELEQVIQRQSNGSREPSESRLRQTLEDTEANLRQTQDELHTTQKELDSVKNRYGCRNNEILLSSYVQSSVPLTNSNILRKQSG